MATLYETDFALWAGEQAGLMRSGLSENLDCSNLAEELECMVRKEHDALHLNTGKLIASLLRWRHQPVFRCNSWKAAVSLQRRNIARLFKHSPSLKADLEDSDWLKDVWTDGVCAACIESGLAENSFPENPVWTIAQILDDSFYPEEDGQN